LFDTSGVVLSDFHSVKDAIKSVRRQIHRSVKGFV